MQLGGFENSLLYTIADVSIINVMDGIKNTCMQRDALSHFGALRAGSLIKVPHRRRMPNGFTAPFSYGPKAREGRTAWERLRERRHTMFR